jgi:uncharacterized coiled-coil protein SlyX
MEDSCEQHQQLRALAMRVAALEGNVAFLEEWCEEQQDTLDRTAGQVGFDYEVDPEPERPIPRAVLRVVDLRDGAAEGEETEVARADSIFAVVETTYDRRIRQVRAQINRLRSRLALSVAPPAEEPPAEEDRAPHRAAGKKNVSAKPAGRTAP